MIWIELLGQASQSLVELIRQSLYRHVEVGRHLLHPTRAIWRRSTCWSSAEVVARDRSNVEVGILVYVVLVYLVDLPDLSLDLADLPERLCYHKVRLRRATLALHLRLILLSVGILEVARWLRRWQSLSRHLLLALLRAFNHFLALRLVHHHRAVVARVDEA